MINKVDESEREIVYLRDELLQEIEQYGIDAFEITEVIDYAFSQAELDTKEKVYISLHKSLIVENIKNVNNIEDFNIPSGNGIFIINNTSNYGVGGYNKTSGGSGFRWTEKAKQNARDAWDDDMKAETSLLPQTMTMWCMTIKMKSFISEKSFMMQRETSWMKRHTGHTMTLTCSEAVIQTLSDSRKGMWWNSLKASK